jgi:hypothetical protein
VSVSAPSSRWDIALEYNVEVDDDESDGEHGLEEDNTDER